MKLKIDPEMLIRIPQFSIQTQLEEAWPALKESIRLASDDFYKTIEHVRADQLDTLPAAVYHAVWKYFNRAKYRPTPYGSFAGFGITPFTFDTPHKGIRIADKQHLHLFTSWNEVAVLLQQETVLQENASLFANSTWYKVGHRIRYLIHDNGLFQLAEVAATPAVEAILTACAVPIPLQDLRNRTVIPEGTDVLADMINLQLLLTDEAPNIIGEDYFNRMGKPRKAGQSVYVLAERTVSGASLNREWFKHLPELSAALATLTPAYSHPDMDQFKKRFAATFEQRWVPLMTALDPEAGVGYGDFEELLQTDSLIKELAVTRIDKPAETNQHLSAFLLNKVLANTTTDSIQLEEYVQQLPKTSVNLPNTQGILCTVSDGLLIAEPVVGASVNVLAGRFSLASDEVTAFCRKTASLEQQANPDVIFFDIAYTSEITVDNVNRRRQIYPYQLSLLNYDTSDKPLTLPDIYVGLRQDEVILYSRSHAKRIVPRMASAYNYERSDLAVFRFLCDLQHQGLNMGMHFSLSARFPGLQHYPRVQYKNIVLSPAKWKLDYKDMQTFSHDTEQERLVAYLGKLGAARFLISRTADRTLCFDSTDESDCAALTYILKKFSSIYLEEGFVPAAPLVNDHSGKPYQHQLLLSLMHSHEIYPGVTATLPSTTHETGVQQRFLPGSEWLYFEIFSHSYRADHILTDTVSNFLALHRQAIRCWFFIRYNEGGNHLRVRIRLLYMEDGYTLIAGMSSMLNSLIEAGIVTDCRMRTYQRETERYGSTNISTVEEHFEADSTYVLRLLQQPYTAMEKYKLCVNLALYIRDLGIIATSIFDNLTEHSFNAFFAEHQLALPAYKLLNQAYRDFQKTKEPLPEDDLLFCQQQFYQSLAHTLRNCAETKVERLWPDLLHMHINRLFPDQQRTHEMAVYYLLAKHTKYRQVMDQVQRG